MNMLDMQKKAQEIVGIDGWVAWQFQSIKNGILCVGAVCPLITRGKNKGQPNYRKFDKKTLQRVVIERKTRDVEVAK